MLMVHHLTATGRRLPYRITVLPATRHKRMCPALTPAMQAGTQFTYGYVNRVFGSSNDRVLLIMYPAEIK